MILVLLYWLYCEGNDSCTTEAEWCCVWCRKHHTNTSTNTLKILTLGFPGLDGELRNLNQNCTQQLSNNILVQLPTLIHLDCGDLGIFALPVNNEVKFAKNRKIKGIDQLGIWKDKQHSIFWLLCIGNTKTPNLDNCCLSVCGAAQGVPACW